MKTDNELISEFMGCTKPPNPDFDYFWKGEFFKSCNAKWDKSWDWLMPVVEKIGKIELKDGRYGNHAEFTISTTEDSGWIFWLKSVPGDQNQPQSYPRDGTLIHRVYKAVVEFIKWYKSQK